MSPDEYKSWFEHKPTWEVEAYNGEWYQFSGGFAKPQEARDAMMSERLKRDAQHVGCTRLRVVRITKYTTDTLNLGDQQQQPEPDEGCPDCGKHVDTASACSSF